MVLCPMEQLCHCALVRNGCSFPPVLASVRVCHFNVEADPNLLCFLSLEHLVSLFLLTLTIYRRLDVIIYQQIRPVFVHV